MLRNKKIVARDFDSNTKIVRNVYEKLLEFSSARSSLISALFYVGDDIVNNPSYAYRLREALEKFKEDNKDFESKLFAQLYNVLKDDVSDVKK